MAGNSPEQFRGLLLIGSYAGDPDLVIRHDPIIFLRAGLFQEFVSFIADKNWDTTGL
jgi:hypothetical protein